MPPLPPIPAQKKPVTTATKAIVLTANNNTAGQWAKIVGTYTSATEASNALSKFQHMIPHDASGEHMQYTIADYNEADGLQPWNQGYGSIVWKMPEPPKTSMTGTVSPRPRRI